MKTRCHLINIDGLWKIEPLPPAEGSSKWCSIEADAHLWAKKYNLELIRARWLDTDRNLEAFPKAQDA